MDTKTELLYMDNSYQKETDAIITSLSTQGSTTTVTLDKTIFYPQGGGQPADVGQIIAPHGSLQITHVSYNEGAPKHIGKQEGIITVGEHVKLQIDWEKRYRNMQLHTAGHIIDLAVKRTVPKAKPIDGQHGIGKKAYVSYENIIDESLVDTIQKEIDSILQKKLPISFEYATKDEMGKKGIDLPFDLPTNKKLRLMYIGDNQPLPDGGTHLKNTGEQFPISIVNIEKNDSNGSTIHYIVKFSQKKDTEKTQTKTMTLESYRACIQSIIDQAVIHAQSISPDEYHQQYFSKKGKVSECMQLLQLVQSDNKKEAGILANAMKKKLVELTPKPSATSSHLDLTIPGIKPKVGHVHPISQAMDEITHIFEKIGFMRVRYPEVDWEWYPFDSLNMPKNHPARDEWETFLVASKFIHPTLGKMVLTPHTSNGQVREMQRLHSKPPIRMINIARCYRRQADVTHTEMFHQFEGLVVDKGITIQHLKGTIDYFARSFYGPGAKSRIRPFHFMFTEPSFEVDFSCSICNGTGEINGEKCRFCKSGWHEVGGAGMVHPNVLKAGGIDPNEYTGFAFGWGIERTYTLRKGLKIDDIRLLYSGNMKFLEQF